MEKIGKLEFELREQELENHCQLFHYGPIFCLRASPLLYSGLLQSKWPIKDSNQDVQGVVSDTRVNVGETSVMGCKYKNVSSLEIFPVIELKHGSFS